MAQNKKKFKEFVPGLLKIQKIKKSLDPVMYKKHLPEASEWLVIMLAYHILKKDIHDASVKKLVVGHRLSFLFDMLKIPAPLTPVSHRTKAGMVTAFLYAVCGVGYNIIPVLREYVSGIDEIEDKDYVALATELLGDSIDLKNYLTMTNLSGGRVRYTLSIPGLKVITGSGKNKWTARQKTYRKYLNYMIKNSLPWSTGIESTANSGRFLQEHL